MTPTRELIAAEHLDLLTEAELNELSIISDALVGGEGPYEFIARVWPHEPVPPHLRPIVDAVQRARVMPIRLCISVPPGHAKTTVLLRLLVWWLSRSPADLCAYLTYNDSQAREKSEEVVDGARAAGIRFKARHGKARSEKEPSFSLWRTDRGGGLAARGIEGGVMGKRIPGLLIIDDPYKDIAEAESELRNEKIKRRLKNMARTRLQGGSIIIVHTRYLEDDLIGYAHRELGWEYINIPAIAEDPDDFIDETTGQLRDDYVGDALGWRKPGEAAWPDRYPVKYCSGPCGHDGHLEEHMDDPDLFAALYQGRPQGGGGGMFADDGLPIIEPDAVPDGGSVCVGWDLAYTKGRKSAWTVRVKVKIVYDIIYILDVLRERVAAADLLDFIERTEKVAAGLVYDEATKQWEPGGVGEWAAVDVPEDGPAGATFTADLAKRLVGFAFFWSRESGGSKKVRAMPFAAQCKAKRVKLVRGPWNTKYRSEARTFPVGVFKDQIDATVRAVKRAWATGEGGGWIGGSRAVG